MLPRKDLSPLSIYFSHMEVYDALDIYHASFFLPLESCYTIKNLFFVICLQLTPL